MRRVIIPAAIVGAIAFILLIARFGLGAVFAAMQTLGWGGLAAIVAFHLLVIVVTGFSWRLLAKTRAEGGLPCFLWGRLIREAGGETLPFSQVGGFVMGARAAALCGVSGTFAAASTVVDVTLELAARVPYMFLGLGLLLWGGLDQHASLMLIVALLIAAAAAICVVLQGRGADLIARLGARLMPQWLADRSAGAAGEMLDSIRAIHARRGALLGAFLGHFLGWVMSGLEVALPLWLMGRPVWIGTGIAIDCLISAMRSLTFMVPASIGVQEGAYVLACGIFGIDPQVALALSLLRRGRDITIAIPSLTMWQLLEGRLALRGLGLGRLTALFVPSSNEPRGPE